MNWIECDLVIQPRATGVETPVHVPDRICSHCDAETYERGVHLGMKSLEIDRIVDCAVVNHLTIVSAMLWSLVYPIGAVLV